MKNGRRFLQLFFDEKGTAAIEFGMVGALPCFLLVGLIDFGMGYWERIQAGNAARAGRQYAIFNGWVQSKVTTGLLGVFGPKQRLFSNALSFGFRNLCNDQRGTIAVMTGLCAAVLFGFSALAIDVASWQVAQRSMQGAADTAAYSAGIAYNLSNGTSIVTQAKGITAAQGYVDGRNGATVTVNQPPKSGGYTSNATAIEVIIQQPQPPFFSGLFLSSNPMVSARAVSTDGPGNGCVLALDTANVTGASASGGATLNLNNCSLYVDASSTQALQMSGGATINAVSAYISGNDSTSGGASLNTTKGTFTDVAPTSDPYANVSIPSYSGCSQTNFNLSGGASKALSAGPSGVYVFCNGLSLSGGASLTLNPGIYVIDRGSFNLSGGSTFNATGGVTIVLTSSTGSNYATASISGGATVSITAPTSGPTAGLAFFQDRNAPSSGTDTFSGGTNQTITGAIYFPHQIVNYSGGSTTGSSQCTQLVAYTMTFSGGSTFNNNCVGVGTAAIGHGSLSSIVE